MDPYVGEIRQFSGDYAPRDWAFCNGQLLPIKEHEALYVLIGTTFGGDGVTNFAVPDLQGRIPLHGTDSFPLGKPGGEEEVTLTEAQLPAHTHLAHASNNNTPNHAGPENAFWGSVNSSFGWATGPGDMPLHPDSIKPAGGGLPHENRMPFVTISYIISLAGIYPQPD